MKVRKDIKNKDVMDLYSYFSGNKRAVAAFLDCSEQLINSVLNGMRKDPDEVYHQSKICSCCKKNPVAPGNHMLCESCYSRGGEPEYYAASLRSKCHF